MMSANMWDKVHPSSSSHKNIIWQSPLSKYAFWRNLGIQVGGCEIPMEAKIEEGHFDKACLDPGIRPDASDVVPAVDLEVPLTPVNSASALLVQSATNPIHQKTQEHPCLLVLLANRH